MIGKCKETPQKWMFKGAYRPPLVYAIALLSGSGSPGFKGHLDLSNGVRCLQKPSQSIQHMWIIWIWHQEQWKWPKNNGISQKTILNYRRNKESHFVCPLNPIRWAQIHSETISVISAHLKCMDLTLRTMILAKNHGNYPNNGFPIFPYSFRGFLG